MGIFGFASDLFVFPYQPAEDLSQVRVVKNTHVRVIIAVIIVLPVFTPPGEPDHCRPIAVKDVPDRAIASKFLKKQSVT